MFIAFFVQIVMVLSPITLAGLLLLGYVSGYAQHNLEVIIRNVTQPKGGVVLIALFDTADAFLKSPVQSKRVSVTGIEVHVTFSNLTQGDYALSVFQDFNHNEKLDTNFLGIPNEPYGFSNDAMGTFGPPSFEKAKIKVTGATQVVINLR
jgi:uncharacterized protein (DUF2141 family)